MGLILKNCSKTLLALGMFGLSPFLFGQLREGPTGHQLFSIAPVAVHPGFETDLTVTTNTMGEIQGIVSGMAGLEMVSVTKVDVKPPVAANTPPGRPAARPPMTTPANQSLWVIRVRIPNDAPTGLYDLRLTGTFGVSNPRMLMVRSSKSDQATERVEVEPNGDLAEALPLRQGEGITGSIQNPTDVDYFKVEAVKVKNSPLSFVPVPSTVACRLPWNYLTHPENGRLPGGPYLKTIPFWYIPQPPPERCLLGCQVRPMCWVEPKRFIT